MSKKRDFASFTEVSVPADSLPEELWLQISQHVDLETLQQLGLVNKKHQRINNTDLLWKSYLTSTAQTEGARKTFIEHPEHVSQEALLSHPLHKFLLNIAKQKDQDKAAKELTEKACDSVTALKTLLYSPALFQTITSSSDGALFLKKLFCEYFAKTKNLFADDDSIDYHEAVELTEQKLDMEGACLFFLEELRLFLLPEEKYKVVRQFLSSKDLDSLFDFSPSLSEEQIVKITKEHHHVKRKLLKEAYISSNHALSLLRTEVSSDLIMSNTTLLNPIVARYVEAALFTLMSLQDTVFSYEEFFSVLETICRAHNFEEMYQYLLPYKNYNNLDLNIVSQILIRKILTQFMQGDIPNLSMKAELVARH